MKTFWAMLGGVGVVCVLLPMRPFEAPSPVAASDAPSRAHNTASVLPFISADVTLSRAADGHFYADALVNGQPVRFIVDTGATRVALTRADAARLGIAPAETEFTETAKGATGAVKFKPVSLDRISVGGIEARQVQAAVVQGDMAVSLLGQSWLKNVGTVSISRNTMVLR